MKDETKKLLEYFEMITRVRPISGRLEVGSMKGTITFRMLKTDDVKNFISNENYYQKKLRIFKGQEIKYIGNNFETLEDIDFNCDIESIKDKISTIW